MSLMYFDAQPIPEVETFIKEHYKGGTVVDFGCGCGRYAHCFPDDMYIGIDGHKGNIDACKELFPNKKFIVQDLEGFKDKYDYLFSSVVLDQIDKLPEIYKHLIMIENEKYAPKFNPTVNQPLGNTPETRMMFK